MKSIAIDIEAIGLDPWLEPTVWIIAMSDGKSTTYIENCNGIAISQIKEDKKIS